MKDIILSHAQHAFYTFLGTFLTVLTASLKLAGHIEWTTSFWAALIIAAATAAIKEVFAQWAPVSFGGRRGLFGKRKGSC